MTTSTLITITSGQAPVPKHTPWTFDHATRTVRGTDGKNVCLVSETVSGHLLAAAPELLAAAKESLRGMECASALLNIVIGVEDIPSPGVQRLQAIIDKAEGRHE